MSRDDLAEQIADLLAAHRDVGPDCARTVLEHVQVAVQRFDEGSGDRAAAEIRRARGILATVNRAADGEGKQPR